MLRAIWAGLLAVCIMGWQSTALAQVVPSDNTDWFGATDPISGTWRVTLDAGLDSETSFVIGIRPPATRRCIDHPSGGCIQQIIYDTSAGRLVPFRLDLRNYGDSTVYSEILMAQASAGQINLTRAWDWRRWSVELTRQSDGSYRGTWQGENRSGTELWEPLPLQISHFGTTLDPDTLSIGAPETLVPAGAVIPVQMNAYDSYNRDPGRDNPFFRGSSRPRFRTYVYAENVFHDLGKTYEHILFPDSPDFEVYAQGAIRGAPDANGNRAVTGFYFDTIMWRHARPGLHRLQINDQSFDMFLDMPGADTGPIARGALGFAGWADDGAAQRGSLNFAGFASDGTAVAAALRFAGFATDGEDIAGTLSFAGFAADGADIAGTLSFAGFGAGDDMAAGRLTFSGFASDGARQSGALRFAGFASDGDMPAARLAFTGFASDGAEISGALAYSGWASSENPLAALAFSGWADPNDDYQGSLAFTGFADNTTPPPGALAFSGWADPTSAIPARLGFDGCERPAPLSDAEILPPESITAHYASTDIGPNIALEGNWIIEWQDAIRPFAYAVLGKGGSWSCVELYNCRYGFSRDPAAPWLLHTFAPDLTTFAVPVELDASGKIGLDHYYGMLGHWGGSFTGHAGPEFIAGQWSYGEDSGTETWRRVRPSIRAASGSDGAIIPLGDPVVLQSQFAGPEYNARGNRPSVTLRVYGENLWGHQRFWLPENSGIEIWSMRYVCSADGSVVSDSFLCLHSGTVSALEFTLSAWPEALPGRHYLYLGTQPIAFDLRLDGHAEAAMRAACTEPARNVSQ